MAKTQPLTNLVKMPLKRKPLRAPPGLGKAGRHLWGTIQREYDITDSGGVAFLVSACRSEDDICRLRTQVARDGDTVIGRYGQREAHPLLAAIRGLEQVKRQSLAKLNLDIEPLKDVGRPRGK